RGGRTLVPRAEDVASAVAGPRCRRAGPAARSGRTAAVTGRTEAGIGGRHGGANGPGRGRRVRGGAGRRRVGGPRSRTAALPAVPGERLRDARGGGRVRLAPGSDPGG